MVDIPVETKDISPAKMAKNEKKFRGDSNSLQPQLSAIAISTRPLGLIEISSLSSEFNLPMLQFTGLPF